MGIIKALFLDMDDTILDFERSERESVSFVMRSFGVEPTERNVRLYHEINARQWRLLEKGVYTRDEILTRRFRLFFDKLNVKADIFSVQSLYESTLAVSAYVMDGAQDFLERAAGKYRLFLASNGTEYVQRRRIDLSGIGRFFENIFISGEIGFNKPAPEFFSIALQKCGGLEAEECVMIGDSLTSDILGGRNAGMKTVYFNRNPGSARNLPAVPDVSVNNLLQIDGALEYIEILCAQEA
ncbi:MAG: YjjG family noncanonical pyrimidine nucleotidase [Clostridia bacterium]|nr:YjjG family noncanonical pyrimidine nucleotidase [Clostridia bacterium]